MADLVEHAARHRRVLDLDRVADLAQAERAQRVELAAVGAVFGLELRHLHAGSVPSEATAGASGSSGDGTSALVSGVAASATVSGVGGSRPASTPASATESAGASATESMPRPRTLLIDRPRRSATSS